MSTYRFPAPQGIPLGRKASANGLRKGLLRGRASLAGVFLLLGLFASGCDFVHDGLSDSKGPHAVVMTRNLYLGADFNIIVGAQPNEIPVRAAEFYAAVQATNFPERARALAVEIARSRPALIGLQEVALYRTQSPSDFTGPNAQDVALDFLALLQAELRARGQRYRLVNEVMSVDAELPAALSETALTDVRLTLRNVILAREGVQTSGSKAENYSTNLQIPVGDATVTFLRGYGMVEAAVRGQRFTFVNTHLETAAAAPVQVAQANELIGVLSRVEGPVVLAGDFNSAAPGAASTEFNTDTYNLLAQPFTDAYAEARPDEEAAYTCCQAADLLNETSRLTGRIDLILYRGEAIKAVLAWRVGEEADDRTPSGRWPSDHAGVVAVLAFN